jgi:hypothetical protein
MDEVLERGVEYRQIPQARAIDVDVLLKHVLDVRWLDTADAYNLSAA